MLGVLSMLGLLVLIVLIVLDHAARCARTSPMMPIKNGAMSSTIDGVSSAVDRRTGRCGRARLLRPSSLGAGCYERAPHFFFFGRRSLVHLFCVVQVSETTMRGFGKPSHGGFAF
jgi:hypothetical protein